MSDYVYKGRSVSYKVTLMQRLH